MYASPVLDISGCSWLGLRASSADRDAVVEPLDPTTDKLSLLARTLALGFFGENRVQDVEKSSRILMGLSHLVERSSQHKKAS